MVLIYGAKIINGIVANVETNIQDIVLSVLQIYGAKRIDAIAAIIVILFAIHANQNHVSLNHGNVYLKHEANRIGKNNSPPRSEEKTYLYCHEAGNLY